MKNDQDVKVVKPETDVTIDCSSNDPTRKTRLTLVPHFMSGTSPVEVKTNPIKVSDNTAGVYKCTTRNVDDTKDLTSTEVIVIRDVSDQVTITCNGAGSCSTGSGNDGSEGRWEILDLSRYEQTGDGSGGQGGSGGPGGSGSQGEVVVNRTLHCEIPDASLSVKWRFYANETTPAVDLKGDSILVEKEGIYECVITNGLGYEVGARFTRVVFTTLTTPKPELEGVFGLNRY